jgi:hypothetical protein
LAREPVTECDSDRGKDRCDDPAVDLDGVLDHEKAIVHDAEGDDQQTCWRAVEQKNAREASES